MKNTLKSFIVIAALVLVYSACKKQDYSMGDLTAPSNIVITTEIVGVDATHPNGDGSGLVNITVTADNGMACKIAYNPASTDDYKQIPLGNTVSKKLTTSGLNTYHIGVIVSGKGGISSTAAKDISVQSDFTPDPAIVTDLTNNTSKTWVVDRSIPAHFGVGPWSVESVNPEWWAGAVDEKLVCCPCFYSATFTFTQVTAKSFSLAVATPDGAFTKTGTLAGGLPGIPSAGDEACYSYSGGTSAFSFVPASSGVPITPIKPANSSTTSTSIMLSGVTTFIGYGACLKEYEILDISPTSLYVRVQGTETGDAWYIKLKPTTKK